MPNNYISRGEVLNLYVNRDYESGKPVRLYGFNGVVLESTKAGYILPLMVSGVFEFELEGVNIGNVILIDENHKLSILKLKPDKKLVIYGRAVSATGDDGKFCCLILHGVGFTDFPIAEITLKKSEVK